MVAFDRLDFSPLTFISHFFAADRAKQIRVHATINENSVDKLIRQLREENEKLKKTMEKGITELPGSNPASTDSGNYYYL